MSNLVIIEHSGGYMSFTFFQIFVISLLTIGKSLIATETLTSLKEGNLRFVENKAKCHQITEEIRLELAKSQDPIATVIVCSDSRVPPEQVFDQNPGKLFVVRLAGNVVDQYALASIEYGVTVLKTPLIIVMGHQNCGAVKEAFNLSEKNYSANIGSLLSEIYPSIRKVIGETHLSKEKQLKLAIQYNVDHTHQQMLIRSPVIRSHVKEKKLEIVDAYFTIDSGKVEWGPFNKNIKPFWKS